MYDVLKLNDAGLVTVCCCMAVVQCWLRTARVAVLCCWVVPLYCTQAAVNVEVEPMLHRVENVQCWVVTVFTGFFYYFVLLVSEQGLVCLVER